MLVPNRVDETDELETDFILPVSGWRISGIVSPDSRAFLVAPSSGSFRICCDDCRETGMALFAVPVANRLGHNLVKMALTVKTPILAMENITETCRSIAEAITVPLLSLTGINDRYVL